ncbi:DUF732 domain-containing protein [Actinoplanes sp. NPDC049599]|uniref:DUF732 domain-containing protein n=1 Tax=Actinoplanes sp. NPDC049599 TaxID=3363903 RepID=UPI0037BC02A5
MARRWLVVGVLLLALGGCGDGNRAEPATVPVPVTGSGNPPPSRTAVAAAVPERADGNDPGGFVAVVQRKRPDLAVDHREDELLALAEQACAALAAGRSADAVVADVRTFGTDRADARVLVRLAITTVCPEQERRIDDF